MNDSDGLVTPRISRNSFTAGAALVTAIIGGAVEGGVWTSSGVCTGLAELEGCPTFLLVKESAPWLLLLAVPLSIIPARLDPLRSNLWVGVFIFASAVVRFGLFGHPEMVLDSVFFFLIVTGAMIGRYAVFLLEKRRER